MGIDPISSNLLNSMASNMNVGAKIGTALLSKQLDMQEDLGAGMVKMMEHSVNPALGSNFDMSV